MPVEEFDEAAGVFSPWLVSQHLKFVADLLWLRAGLAKRNPHASVRCLKALRDEVVHAEPDRGRCRP
jgi:hypothetical protein